MPDPLVHQLDSFRACDRVEERAGPRVLEQDHHGRRVGVERLRHAEDVVLVEDVPVRELRRARDRAAFEALGPVGREAGERAEVRAERGRLPEVEVARGRDQGVTLSVLAHDQHVDDADDPLALQAVELGKDLALEAVARKREREHLDRPEVLHSGERTPLALAEERRRRQELKEGSCPGGKIAPARPARPERSSTGATVVTPLRARLAEAACSALDGQGRYHDRT